MTYEDAVVKMLCEINNRMADIAITLQAAVLLNATSESDTRQIWLNKLSELVLAQGNKYATLELKQA